MNRLVKKTRVITLSSKSGEKLNGSFNSRIKFNIPTIGELGKHIISQEFSIQTFGIPNSTYNINSNNNRLELVYLTHVHYFFITPGFYSISALLTELSSLTSYEGFTYAYSPLLGKITITNAGMYFSVNSASTIRNIMGLSETANQIAALNPITGNYDCQMANVISMFPVQVIIVRCGQFQLNNYNDSDQSSDALVSIFNNVAQNQMLVYNNDNPDMKYHVSNSNLNDFTISITDLDGTALDLNGCHWYASLLFMVTLELPENPYDWTHLVENNKKRTADDISNLLDEFEY